MRLALLILAPLGLFALLVTCSADQPPRAAASEQRAAQADVMVSVDGQPIKALDDLLRYMERRETGDRVILKVIRQGHVVTIRLDIGNAG